MAEPPATHGPTDKPRVTVRVPGLLARFTDGQRSVAVRAETVDGSLERLLEAYPALKPHLLDERGRLRPHLKLFHDGMDVTGQLAGAAALTEGAEVVVFQAVSGG